MVCTLSTGSVELFTDLQRIVKAVLVVLVCFVASSRYISNLKKRDFIISSEAYVHALPCKQRRQVVSA